MRLAAGEGLDAMRQRVDAGGGGDTRGGTVSVRSGSTTARSASMWRLCTASLFCVAGSVTSARVPASLPVPEVVGTCTSAHAAARHLLRPDDVVEGLPAAGQSTATSLARSMALPPPKPTTRSGCNARAPAASRLLEVGHVRLGLHLAEDRRPRRAGQLIDARRVEGIRDHQRRAAAPFRSAQRPTAATVPGPNSMTVGRSNLDRREGGCSLGVRSHCCRAARCAAARRSA